LKLHVSPKTKTASAPLNCQRRSSLVAIHEEAVSATKQCPRQRHFPQPANLWSKSTCRLPVFGTKLPIRDVRYPLANGGKPDMTQAAQFGRRWPISDIRRLSAGGRSARTVGRW